MSPVHSADISDDEIEDWLYLSGLMTPSVEALRRHIPRWRHYLGGLDITNIPSPFSADPADTNANNVLCLLVRQASLVRDPQIEHNLRNLTGVRPYKH